MNGNKKEDGDNDGAGSDKAVVETTVCCGCRPSRRKYQKEPGGRHYMRTLSSHFFRRAQYVDAEQGNDSVWVNDIDSQFFFDAEEEPLGEDEYPPFFTTALQHPKPVVSMDHPETLLKSQLIEPQEPDSKLVAVPAKTCKRLESFPIANHRVPSFRFQKMIRRPTLERKTELETPRVKLTEQGYPGELTFAELAECVSNYCLCLYYIFVQCSIVSHF